MSIITLKILKDALTKHVKIYNLIYIIVFILNQLSEKLIKKLSLT